MKARFSRLTSPRTAAAIALGLVLPAANTAPRIESPPTFNAAQIPGITRVGSNYTVESPVRSDGLLRDYVLATPYGQVAVRGDAMLRMRTNELAALSRLEKVSNSQSFTRALAEAGLSPLKYTGQFIANPVKTLGDTFAGIGGLFGRIHSDINNAGKTQDNAVAGVLGVTSQRRELAAAYGVDPYTDFQPLDAKLKQLSEAAALGGLAVTGALLAVPGAAGIVVSNLSNANKLNNVAIDELARNYTASQILDLNRALLAKMGVAPEVSASLLANRNYTPIDLAAMLAALDSMGAVQDRYVFVERAAAADVRSTAFFSRRRAELLADDYRRHGNYVRFVSLVSYPFVETRDGRIEALLPVDALSWTAQTSEGFAVVTAARKRIAPHAHGVLRITGTATALAKRALTHEGWRVLERQ
jgi:hypothetical protein